MINWLRRAFQWFLLGEIRVELIVPHTEQRCCDVKPFSIQTELNHLRSSFHSLPLHVTRLRLSAQFRVLYHLHWAVVDNTAANKQLKGIFKKSRFLLTLRVSFDWAFCIACSAGVFWTRDCTFSYLGRHLGFGNCGGLGRGNISRGSRR